MLRLALFSLAVALAATSAQPQTKDRLDRRDKLFGFEAVGRLESASGHCTAALIAPDVVLTAAHCAYGKRGHFVFRAAYSDGAALATRNVTDVVIAEGYIKAAATNDRAREVSNDVALMRLVSPIHDAGINPYSIAQAPRAGARLTLASYGRGRTEALTLERGCVLETRYHGGVVRIDCAATYGSSGAPVFVTVNGRPRIFAVVSSGITENEPGARTFGTELSALVPGLMQKLRNTRGLAPPIVGARREKVGERPKGVGRFLRPGEP